tara:strand:- start:668 stop:1084 length:417 start_codon:yes stop_codon:yes gene_type:complete
LTKTAKIEKKNDINKKYNHPSQTTSSPTMTELMTTTLAPQTTPPVWSKTSSTCSKEEKMSPVELRENLLSNYMEKHYPGMTYSYWHEYPTPSHPNTPVRIRLTEDVKDDVLNPREPWIWHMGKEKDCVYRKFLIKYLN